VPVGPPKARSTAVKIGATSAFLRTLHSISANVALFLTLDHIFSFGLCRPCRVDVSLIDIVLL
jgi:hypothetical protein